MSEPPLLFARIVKDGHTLAEYPSSDVQYKLARVATDALDVLDWNSMTPNSLSRRVLKVGSVTIHCLLMYGQSGQRTVFLCIAPPVTEIRRCHGLLTALYKETQGRPVAELPAILKNAFVHHSDPAHDRVCALHQEVDALRCVAVDTVDKLTRRGARLESLQASAFEFKQEASRFETTTVAVRQRMWCRNCCLRIFILVFPIVAIIAFLALYFGLPEAPNILRRSDAFNVCIGSSYCTSTGAAGSFATTRLRDALLGFTSANSVSSRQLHQLLAAECKDYEIDSCISLNGSNGAKLSKSGTEYVNIVYYGTTTCSGVETKTEKIKCGACNAAGDMYIKCNDMSGEDWAVLGVVFAAVVLVLCAITCLLYCMWARFVRCCRTCCNSCCRGYKQVYDRNPAASAGRGVTPGR